MYNYIIFTQEGITEALIRICGLTDQPQGYKKSCSTQMSVKFQLLIKKL